MKHFFGGLLLSLGTAYRETHFRNNASDDVHLVHEGKLFLFHHIYTFIHNVGFKTEASLNDGCRTSLQMTRRCGYLV